MHVKIEYSNEDTQSKHNDYITDEERQHIISELHRLLVWVGEPLPDTVNVQTTAICCQMEKSWRYTIQYGGVYMKKTFLKRKKIISERLFVY